MRKQRGQLTTERLHLFLRNKDKQETSSQTDAYQRQIHTVSKLYYTRTLSREEPGDVNTEASNKSEDGSIESGTTNAYCRPFLPS